MNKISKSVGTIIKLQQPDFRTRKSCTRQILNLIQHIRDGFEKRKITKAVFLDLIKVAFNTSFYLILVRK